MNTTELVYEAPTTVEEVVDLLARWGGEARPLAGGMSLMPDMHLGVHSPRALVSLARVDELAAPGIHEGMAVVRRLGDARRAGGAAGAGDVLDHHRLAEAVGDGSPDNAAEHVGLATGRERNHERDGPSRPILRDDGRAERCNDRDHHGDARHGSSPADVLRP